MNAAHGDGVVKTKCAQAGAQWELKGVRGGLAVHRGGVWCLVFNGCRPDAMTAGTHQTCNIPQQVHSHIGVRDANVAERELVPRPPRTQSVRQHAVTEDHVQRVEADERGWAWHHRCDRVQPIVDRVVRKAEPPVTQRHQLEVLDPCGNPVGLSTTQCEVEVVQ